MSLANVVSRFIYYPDPNWIVTPDRMGLRAEDLHIPSEPGVELHAWFFALPQATGSRDQQGLNKAGAGPAEKPVATLLFCHGNAGNVSHRLENVYYLLQAGFQVLLFDYRGYDHSSGQPSEEGLYRDAAAAWEHLLSREDTTGAPRIIFGRSLGGAVAVDLASHAQADGLIIESTFTSIRTLTRLVFPWPLPRLPVKYDSLSKIGNLSMPLLAIHGVQDELIPYADGQALFRAAPEPKTWVPIPGAGHNDTYTIGGTAYFRRLAGFADGLCHS
jgi:fermentation-respiration switch protein FrsA (DUF1100 family)